MYFLKEVNISFLRFMFYENFKRGFLKIAFSKCGGKIFFRCAPFYENLIQTEIPTLYHAY